MTEARELLTTAEVADLADVSVETVRRWVKAGYLRPALRYPTGRERFRRNDVVDLLRPDDDPNGDTPIQAAS
jgi:excisionase family DNA binding protein